MGIMASMALMPVCTGVSTDLREATSGATISTGRVSVVSTGPLPSSGAAERVDHAAYQRVAHGHLDDAARAAALGALLDGQGVAHDDDAHAVLLEVEREADDAALELDELVVGHAGEAVHARDAVADLDDGAHVHHGQLRAELLDLALDNGCDILSPGRHSGLPVNSFQWSVVQFVRGLVCQFVGWSVYRGRFVNRLVVWRKSPGGRQAQ